MSNGGVGVNLFFVLSGLVLYLPYARGKRLDLAEYTAARLLRIVPAAWVALAVSGIVVGIWSWAAVRQMLFVNPWAQQGVSPDPPAWSLTIEIGFYVLLPILAAVFVKRSAYRVPILLSLVVFGTLARHEMTSGGWPKMPLTYVDNFACGMLAAIIVARVGRLPSWTLLIGSSPL
jgi:peptidoglycan/LPS O-acetylase OafA/YrhL